MVKILSLVRISVICLDLEKTQLPGRQFIGETKGARFVRTKLAFVLMGIRYILTACCSVDSDLHRAAGPAVSGSAGRIVVDSSGVSVSEEFMKSLIVLSLRGR